MLKELVNGFCMALADSVPGVSGGTVAFIMGFYDKFIGSVNGLVFEDIKEKKKSAVYIAKLGLNHVSAGNIRFNSPAYIWGIYTCHHGNKRCFVIQIIVYTKSLFLQLWSYRRYRARCKINQILS